MMQLRDYQLDCIESIMDAFRNHFRRILLRAPTGAGKTVIFCEFTKRCINNNNKVLICTDRTEIAQGSDGQGGTVGTLRRFGLLPTVVQQMPMPPIHNNVVVAMAQTLNRRFYTDEDIETIFEKRIKKGENKHLIEKQKEQFKARVKIWLDWLHSFPVIFIDECHESTFDFIFSFLLPSQRVTGVTATPQRSGKMTQLGSLYEKLIFGPSERELIALEHLCPVRYAEMDSGVDFSEVKINSSKNKYDYDERALFLAMDKRELYGGIVKNWKELASDRHTIVFAVSVLHAARLAKEFNDNGIVAKFIHGGKSEPEASDGTEKGNSRYFMQKREFDEIKELERLYSGNRSQIFKDFETGVYHVLINVAIATKGYDCPAINCVVLAMKTLSLPKYRQTAGRGLRIDTKTGKTDCLILDFGQNRATFGNVEADYPFSLWHETKAGGGIVPTKTCGGVEFDTRSFNTLELEQYRIKIDELEHKPCGANIPVSAKVCPKCGYIMEHKKKEKEVELQITKQEIQKPIRQMDVCEIVNFGKDRKWKAMGILRQVYRVHDKKGVIDAINYMGYNPDYINHCGFLGNNN